MPRALCIKIHRAVFSMIVKKTGKKIKCGRRFRREGPYVYLWLTHVDVWHKPAQYCKAIILKLKKERKKEKDC